MNTLDLASRKVHLKKVSNTNGGEWQGPCPECGGEDRFHVWPEQNAGKGGYWCRGCEKAGDNIQFLRDFEGMSFVEACDYLDIPLPERGNPSVAFRGSAPGGVSSFGNKTPERPDERKKPEFIPNEHAAPADLWQEKAEKFLTWSQGNLAKDDAALAWLAARGISAETAVNFRLGWNVGEDGKDFYRARKAWGLPEIFKEDGRSKAFCIPRGLVIPYIVDGVIYRIRIRRPEAHRTPEWRTPYHVIPGSSMAIMTIEPHRRAFVVVESELDAIACAVACPLAGAVALGSVAAKPDADTFVVLQSAIQILNALDYGDIGGGAKAVKRARTWWEDQFPNCARWPVPKGKDPGEAVKLGTDLNSWIEAGLPPVMTIDRLTTKSRDQAEQQTSATAITTEAALESIDNTISSTEAALSTPVGTYAENRQKAEDLRAKEVEIIEKINLSPLIVELRDLLRNNPKVIIINKPNRFTVLRDGRYVGGRINYLVFREPVVTDYILRHPADEIDAKNLIIMEEK